jgi:hypothetical protein
MHANLCHVKERGEEKINVKYVVTKRLRISEAI